MTNLMPFIVIIAFLLASALLFKRTSKKRRVRDKQLEKYINNQQAKQAVAEKRLKDIFDRQTFITETFNAFAADNPVLIKEVFNWLTENIRFPGDYGSAPKFTCDALAGVDCRAGLSVAPSENRYNVLIETERETTFLLQYDRPSRTFDEIRLVCYTRTNDDARDVLDPLAELDQIIPSLAKKISSTALKECNMYYRNLFSITHPQLGTLYSGSYSAHLPDGGVVKMVDQHDAMVEASLVECIKGINGKYVNPRVLFRYLEFKRDCIKAYLVDYPSLSLEGNNLPSSMLGLDSVCRLWHTVPAVVQ